jgi:hypothetical protein
MARTAGVVDLEEKVTAPAPFFLTSTEIGSVTLAQEHDVLMEHDGSFRPARLVSVRLVTDERWKLFRRVALDALVFEHLSETGQL